MMNGITVIWQVPSLLQRGWETHILVKQLIATSARSLFRYLKAYSWKFMASRVACNILGPVIPFASYLLLPFKINYLLIFLCHFKLFFCAFYFHHILLSKYFFPSLSLPSLEEKWTIFHQNISFHLCTYPYIFWCFPFYKVALQPIKTQNFERFAWDWCDTK